MLLCWLLLLAGMDPVAGMAPQIVRADHPDLVYTGRWDFTDPLNPWCEWQGASVAVTFRGSKLAMSLNPGSRAEWYRIIVDGDAPGSQKVLVLSGGFRKVVIASSLGPGVHHVEVVKETYLGTETTFRGFGIFGGTGIVNPPPRPARRIEFYGDSNLAGYSLEHEENQAGSQYIGTTLGLAGIASRRLGAEYHNVSASGESISQIHDKFDRLSWWGENPQWDFSRFVPDLVVVNLGANDVGRPAPQIRADYHAFLDDLRQVHPQAHIVLFNGYGWDYDETANYTDQVIAARNDPNMSSMVFPWLFEQWHGCETDHSGMADYLVDHVQSVLGWVPVDGDVMSGYGRNGDVANGSFEEAAPFGGFGWRYGAHRPQIRRVRAASFARHGDYLLVLENGAVIHQPNPAQPGETVSVSVWLRGATAADQAVVTIDFRDQQIWTAPLQTQSWTLPMTTGWVKHTVQAVAPAGGPHPVFQTRLTIAAEALSTIGVDAVQMTTN